MTTAITDAAHGLAAAIANAEKTDAALLAAVADLDRVIRRKQSLEADRAAIVARRQRGDHQHDDGANLALIAADLEGLHSMIADAEAGVANVRGPDSEARTAVTTARFYLQAAEDEAAEALLIEHARRLEALLMETINNLDAINQRRGGRMPKWSSRRLFEQTRRLLVNGGENCTS